MNIFEIKNFDKFIPKRASSKGKVLDGLGMMNLLVYSGLKYKSDKQNVVIISYQQLSELLGISKSGAQKAIYDLEKAGLIKRFNPAWATETPKYKVLF